MGDYATTTAISELLPQFLSSNTTTSDAAGTSIYSRHIDRAEAVVKSFAGSRYDLSAFRINTTTTNVPPILRTLSEDITCWFSIRGAYVQDGGIKQEYLDAFNRAYEMLKEIREGLTKLTYTDGSEVPPRSSRFLSSTESYSHVFNMDDPESWAVDQDQIDDMDTARNG